MSPRTGRPKSDNPKNVDIKVRIDSDTAEKLDQYCADYSLSRASAIRKGLDLLLNRGAAHE